MPCEGSSPGLSSCPPAEPSYAWTVGRGPRGQAVTPVGRGPGGEAWEGGL